MVNIRILIRCSILIRSQRDPLKREEGKQAMLCAQKKPKAAGGRRLGDGGADLRTDQKTYITV